MGWTGALGVERDRCAASPGVGQEPADELPADAPTSVSGENREVDDPGLARDRDPVHGESTDGGTVHLDHRELGIGVGGSVLLLLGCELL